MTRPLTPTQLVLGAAREMRHRALTDAQTDANETLAALLELIGQRVSVSAAGIDGDPPLALTITGTLAEGTELLPDQVRPSGGDEAFYLSLEEDRGSGFFVHSKDCRGAPWAGPTLEITVGGCVLRVELESGS
jgi:hypothetical protein